MATLVTPTTTEPTINKTQAPTAAFRDQAAAGLYFEYTFGMSKVDDDKGRVLFRNVALFAAGNHILMKRSTAEVTAHFTSPATIKATESQTSFRNLAEPITDAQAFLTVMHAWTYATQRQTLSHMKVVAKSGTTDVITVGAHAVITEPLLFPISTSELEALNKTTGLTQARKLARSAEVMWGTATHLVPHHDTTPAFRIPPNLDEQLRTDTFFGEFSQSLLADPATEHPEYTPPATPHTGALPDLLRNVAIGAGTFKS